MATLDELLLNRDRYTDDTKITLAEGVETTLGDLRGGYSRQADYSRKTQDLARQRQEFDQVRTKADLDLQAAKEEVMRLFQESQKPARRTQDPDEADEVLRTDPVARKLHERANAAYERAEAASKAADAAVERATKLEESLVRERHEQAFQFIQKNDPSINRDELVRFAHSRGIPRIDDAYRLMTEETRMKKVEQTAAEKAHQEGYAKGKQEAAAAPFLAPGRLMPNRSPDAPKTLDEAFAAAASDPEILKAMSGG